MKNRKLKQTKTEIKDEKIASNDVLIYKIIGLEVWGTEF